MAAFMVMALIFRYWPLVLALFLVGAFFAIREERRRREAEARRRAEEEEEGERLHYRRTSPVTVRSKSGVTFTSCMETYAEPPPAYRRPLPRSVYPSGSWPMPRSPSPLRGWTNLGTYELHGINPKTKRSNKRIYAAFTEGNAEEKAAAAGLVPPFQVKEIPSRPISESQRGFLVKMKYPGPYANLTLVDASAVISYVLDGDERLITSAEWAAACAAGYEISALSGPTLYQLIMKTGDWRSGIKNE